MTLSKMFPACPGGAVYGRGLSETKVHGGSCACAEAAKRRRRELTILAVTLPAFVLARPDGRHWHASTRCVMVEADYLVIEGDMALRCDLAPCPCASWASPAGQKVGA